MIISHRHTFVYVKTRKTASTSLEIALAALCGPDDVITKITAEDEAVRRRLGYRGPQNEFIRGPDGRTFELLNHAPATLASFLRTTPAERLSNWHFYADDAEPERVIVSHVGRYESLAESMATISETIGLPGGIVLPDEHTKSHLRTDRRHHRDVLSAEDRQFVETLCHRELAAFGYEW